MVFSFPFLFMRLESLSNIPTIPLLSQSILEDNTPFQFTEEELRVLENISETCKDYSTSDIAKLAYFELKRDEVDYNFYNGILNWFSNK